MNNQNQSANGKTNVKEDNSSSTNKSSKISFFDKIKKRKANKTRNTDSSSKIEGKHIEVVEIETLS